MVVQKYYSSWSYEKTVEWVEKQEAELTELAKASKLPREPDRKFLDQLTVDIVNYFLKSAP